MSSEGAKVSNRLPQGATDDASQAPWSYADVTWPRPLSLARAIFLHASVHLRRVLTVRRLWPYLLLMALPVLASAGLARLALDDTSVIGRFLQYFTLRAMALCALGLGVSAIREDAEGGVLSLVLLRPRATLAVPIGRCLAVTAVVGVLGSGMALGSLAALFGTPFSPDLAYMARAVVAAWAGAFAYTGVFLGFGSWFAAGTAVGLGWLVGVDLVLAPYAEAAALLSPSHYLAILAQTLPGRDLVAANTAGQIPSAVAGLLLVGALGVAASAWRLRGDPPN